MDLTIAAPLKFYITLSLKDRDYANSVAPTTLRETKSNALSEVNERRKNDFFTPTKKRAKNPKRKTHEEVTGTLWFLEYSISGTPHVIHDAMTTKELKSFLLQEGVNTRSTTAIAWIDTTLAYPHNHESKYAYNTAVDYTILEVNQYISSFKTLFKDTDIMSQAEHYMELALGKQSNTQIHQDLEAFKANYDNSTVSKATLLTHGIRLS